MIRTDNEAFEIFETLRRALERIGCHCSKRGPGIGNYAAEPIAHDEGCPYRVAQLALARAKALADTVEVPYRILIK